jgi:hypothetical protein
MQAPFDGRSKTLAEEYPDLLLRLLGILEPGAKSECVDVLRELQIDPVQVDHVYRIVDDAGERLVHLEAITSWSAKRTSRLALYRFLLRQKNKLPVYSYVVLMAEKYAPKGLPDRVTYTEDDGFRIEAPYRVIRLWEIDPAMAFERGGEPLLPWVPLLKAGAAEFERAVDGIAWLAEHPEKAPYPAAVMVSNLATLAGLRYDGDVINRFLEGFGTKMILDKELLMDTCYYKDGVKQGKAEGELEVGRRHLRLMLSEKFPALGPIREIDQLNRTETLDQLFLAVLRARTEEDVRAAVQSALRLN